MFITYVDYYLILLFKHSIYIPFLDWLNYIHILDEAINIAIAKRSKKPGSADKEVELITNFLPVVKVNNYWPRIRNNFFLKKMFLIFNKCLNVNSLIIR